MADETYAPKPLPPDRMVSWPTLIVWRVRGWLSWPWEVRQLKAAGFRRVGWMTWEAGPDDRVGGLGGMAPGRDHPLDALTSVTAERYAYSCGCASRIFEARCPACGQGMRIQRHADHDPSWICRPAGFGLCEIAPLGA